MGLSINIITPDEINALNEDQKQKMMLGIDIENDEEEIEKQRKKEMTEIQTEELRDLKEHIQRKIEKVLDFGGYHLGDDGL